MDNQWSVWSAACSRMVILSTRKNLITLVGMPSDTKKMVRTSWVFECIPRRSWHLLVPKCGRRRCVYNMIANWKLVLRCFQRPSNMSHALCTLDLKTFFVHMQVLRLMTLRFMKPIETCTGTNKNTCFSHVELQTAHNMHRDMKKQ